ncbi:MAG TPA: DUF58 domain-containing protein [Spirochaetota bacterium]|nr:DUF58 domain-containing protein [Spirochaetota bacterium]
MRLRLLREEEKILCRTPVPVKHGSLSSAMGAHTSNEAGSNIEFNEYAQYVVGDELKNIDWKVAAKSERYYIKKYHDDKTIRGYIMLDHSASMLSFTQNRKKKTPADYRRFQTAVYVAFYLSNLYYLNKESLGFFSFADKNTQQIATSSAAATFQHINSALSALKTENAVTDYRRSFADMAAALIPGSEIYIISDFYCRPEQLNDVLKPFFIKKVSITLFNIIDASELNLDRFLKGNDYYFIDRETRDSIYFNAALFKSRYKETVVKHLNALKSFCQSKRIRYVPVVTSRPVFKQFLGIVQ